MLLKVRILLAGVFLRRVLPKAVILAFKFISRTRRKNSMSLLLLPGIAAFNIMDAQCIQLQGDFDFVFRRQTDAFSLGAVTQRGVEDGRSMLSCLNRTFLLKLQNRLYYYITVA